ncbi:MAG: hypothetical protein BWY78_01032 [Alphaproteobacteria bacterium ADurb.Bin438]|nr:MAG: hypothetical protein BWY78_01032 [Alphaproteobacteria bacterium ADurb.Bin438]
MKSLPQNSRVEVIKTSDRLEKAMQDNVLFIKASISASKTLLENIVKSAESSEQENKGFYSRSGKMGSDSKYRSALSVNQVL